MNWIERSSGVSLTRTVAIPSPLDRSTLVPSKVDVIFTTRQGVELDGGTIYIPTVSEQIEKCRLFGRPKDLQRAERLETLLR